MDRVRSRCGTQSIETKQLFQGLVKETLEAFLELGMEERLGYPKYDPEGGGSGNSRDGGTGKTVRGDFGEVEIKTPRDRNSSFEPKSWPSAKPRWATFPKPSSRSMPAV